MIGKGSVNHNTRVFSAKNVDKERSSENIEFCNENIKEVYHQLFDEVLERYNAKQKRSDRKIEDYYEKIRQGKQEKLFHEVIFQIGNKDDMNARSENGELAKEILREFMKEFQSRNPNLHVFSAHLHMDEETPHLHIDFVPVIHNSKRGLETRVSLKGALAVQGFSGGTRGSTEWNQWMESEKQALAAVMEQYGIDWIQKGTHEKHLSVLDYQKKERIKEVENLESLISQSEVQLKAVKKEIASMAKSKDKLERNVRSYDEDEKWQLPEPTIIQTAKGYRDKSAFPLVVKLKELVKSLTIQCVQLTEQVKASKGTIKRLQSDILDYKDRISQMSQQIEGLQQNTTALEYVKRQLGAEKVQSMIESQKDKEKMSKGIYKRNADREI